MLTFLPTTPTQWLYLPGGNTVLSWSVLLQPEGTGIEDTNMIVVGSLGEREKGKEKTELRQ